MAACCHKCCYRCLRWQCHWLRQHTLTCGPNAAGLIGLQGMCTGAASSGMSPAAPCLLILSPCHGRLLEVAACHKTRHAFPRAQRRVQGCVHAKRAVIRHKRLQLRFKALHKSGAPRHPACRQQESALRTGRRCKHLQACRPVTMTFVYSSPCNAGCTA